MHLWGFSQKISKLIAPLKFISTQIFSINISYLDFLDRVHVAQLLLESLGQWVVPHPWIDIFVPASKIEDFDYQVFKKLHADDFSRPVIVYPFNENKNVPSGHHSFSRDW
jgi:cytokinin dehydrogenase